jgi:hypothetical protein
MMGLLKFPEIVTNVSDQSRTLGARLNELLGGETPLSVSQNRKHFREVLIELWHNLPCLSDECLLRSLPLYVLANDSGFQLEENDPDVPEIWQLNQDIAWRIVRLCSQNRTVLAPLSVASEEEQRQLVEFCEIVERDSGESLECFKALIQSGSTVKFENH